VTSRISGPLLVGVLAGALLAGSAPAACACLALALALAWASGARAPARRWLLTVGTGAGIAFVLNALLTPGAPFAWSRALPLHVTRAGIEAGMLMALRLLGAAAAVHGLAAAWPGERAADAVAGALAPLQRLGVPVGEGRMVVGLALRFAPQLASDAQRIARVQDLRAGGPPRGWRMRLARRRAAVVPAIVSALERAEQVSLALEARHYRLRPPAAGVRPVWAACAGGVAIAVAAAAWR
jgi:energy-coupling factor transport system permease protein